ncbi:MAG: cupin domain-containing protein [Gammaproteobacteria bacterium]|nr:cupin domain-containing protein [Gammaproteobacteria bacterium]
MYKHLISSPAERAEILTRERTCILEELNDPAVPGVSLARARVAPGVTTEWHSLSVTEWYVITSGCGLMHVGDEDPFEVTAGDSVEIPAGIPQRIENRGSDDIVFRCICMPRFTIDCYTPLE